VLTEIAGKYAEAEQKDKASEVLSQALQATATLKDGESKFSRFGSDRGFGDFTELVNDYSKPFLLEKIAVRYAEVGQTDKAVQVAKTIQDAEAKASALTEIAGKYIEAGQKDKAVETLSQAIQAAITIDYVPFTVKALEQIAGKYVEAGQKDKAAETLSQALQAAETAEYTQQYAYILDRLSRRLDCYQKRGR
jgi:tetratricopeptide (TPR) repeat protein